MTGNIEWKEVRLGEIIQFNPRETIKKGEISKKIAMDKLKEFSREIRGYEKVPFTSGTKFRNGDTLVARITPCLQNGKTAQVNILNEDEVAFGSTEYIVMRKKENITDKDFIYYLSVSNNFRNIAIKSMTGTSGRQRAQRDVIENSIISLPPIHEQKKIATILKSLDDKIELNNQMNQTLEEMAQTIFKEWFVEFNFPNEDGVPYKNNGGEMEESELGMIPKGWRIGELKELGEIITGKTPSTKKKENYNGAYPFITIPDMHGKTFISQTERSLSEEGNKVQSKKLLPINSIIVSCIATVGLVGINTKPSHTNQQINSIFPKHESYLFYIYELIKSKKDLLHQLGSAGTATLNVNKGVFEKIEVLEPSKEIIEKFYKLIKPIYNTILQRQLESETLIKTRDTLLPKLMSGEVRV